MKLKLSDVKLNSRKADVTLAVALEQAAAKSLKEVNAGSAQHIVYCGEIAGEEGSSIQVGVVMSACNEEFLKSRPESGGQIVAYDNLVAADKLRQTYKALYKSLNEKVVGALTAADKRAHSEMKRLLS